MPKTKRQRLVEKLDRVFSEYVRLYNTDDYGYGNCVTCNARKFYKEADCGHFVTRAKKSVRWLHEPPLVNASLQCKQCNMNGGEQYTHGQMLDAKYGEGTADEVMRLGQQTKQWDLYELQEMLEKYKIKLKKLKVTKVL